MMIWLRLLWENRILTAALFGWLSAQVLKVILTLIITGKLKLERMWGAGGMPSAHSAMVTALTIAIARFCGLNSPVFALALIFTFVTTYDAMGVRREAGRHAHVLNKFINEMEAKNADIDGDGVPDVDFEELDLKEFIGHTPLQVWCGILLGILIGMMIPA